MKKLTKKVSLTLTLVLMLLQFSVISPSYNANAALSYVSSYVTASADIRPSPYAFTPITDTIQNQSITIIERDGLFFYIEYQKSNETTVRRGYIAYEDVNYDKSGIKWCVHSEYNPGHIISNSNVYVYFGPDNRNTNYMWSSTLAPDVGDDTDSKPLLVLRQEGNRYFVQFVLNPTQLSNDVQPFYVRGWVPVSSVTVDKPQGTSYFPGGNGTSFVTLIKNVSNSTSGGLYLTARYNETTNKYYTVLEEPTGYEEQRWRVYPIEISNNKFYYKIKSEKYDLYLHVEDGLPMAGADMTLRELSDPNKAQEFWLQEFTGGKESLIDCDDTSELPKYIYNGEEVGYVYRVRTRVTGGYQAMSIDGVTGVCESRVAATWKDVWSFERLNKFHQYSYDNLNPINGTYTIKYYICTGENNSTDVENANITLYQIRAGIQRWESVLRNGVQVIDTQEVYDKSQAHVIIQAADLTTPREGDLVDYIDGIPKRKDRCLANATIKTNPCIITLNSYTNNDDYYDSIAEYSGQFDHVQTGTICHEFGHALKLKHPYGDRNDNDYYADQVVYSVMTSGPKNYIDKNDNKVRRVYSPSSYDQITLKNKW